MKDKMLQSDQELKDRNIVSQGDYADSNERNEVVNGHIPEDDEDNEYTEISMTNKTKTNNLDSQQHMARALSQNVTGDEGQDKVFSLSYQNSKSNMDDKGDLDKKMADVLSQSAVKTENIK